MSLGPLKHQVHGNEEAQWISLSDLMTGLMMIFLLISILMMMKAQNVASNSAVDVSQAPVTPIAMDDGGNGMPGGSAKRNAAATASSSAAASSAATVIVNPSLATNPEIVKEIQSAQSIRQVAVIYDQARQNLYQELNSQFARDLPQWGATIDKDLTIRFNDPEALFDTGRDQMQPRFQQILADFLPRYVRIITSDKYRNVIQEVRIEGHTSSMWAGALSREEAYFKNMELSQARTRSVLRFMFGLPALQSDADWLRRYVTANGLSSSRPIFNADGSENPQLSQRVEFHIRTDAEAGIATILSKN